MSEPKKNSSPWKKVKGKVTDARKQVKTLLSHLTDTNPRSSQGNSDRAVHDHPCLGPSGMEAGTNNIKQEKRQKTNKVFKKMKNVASRLNYTSRGTYLVHEPSSSQENAEDTTLPGPSATKDLEIVEGPAVDKISLEQLSGQTSDTDLEMMDPVTESIEREPSSSQENAEDTTLPGPSATKNLEIGRAPVADKISLEQLSGQTSDTDLKMMDPVTESLRQDSPSLCSTNDVGQVAEEGPWKEARTGRSAWWKTNRVIKTIRRVVSRLKYSSRGTYYTHEPLSSQNTEDMTLPGPSATKDLEIVGAPVADKILLEQLSGQTSDTDLEMMDPVTESIEREPSSSQENAEDTTLPGPSATKDLEIVEGPAVDKISLEQLSGQTSDTDLEMMDPVTESLRQDSPSLCSTNDVGQVEEGPKKEARTDRSAWWKTNRVIKTIRHVMLHLKYGSRGTYLLLEPWSSQKNSEDMTLPGASTTIDLEIVGAPLLYKISCS